MQPTRHATRLIPRCLLCLLPTALCLLSSGCNIIGAAAQVLPQPDVAPAYTKLSNQTVGVMVWVDRAIAIDYPSLQADVAKSVVNKLQETSEPKKKSDAHKELTNVRYLDPLAVIKWQADHPELNGFPSTELATRLGVTRVIYVELIVFETRSEVSVDLFKGTVMAKLDVLEVATNPDGTKKAKVAYSDGDLRSIYPKKAPEGTAGTDVNSDMIYNKTVDAFTTDVVLKFVQHPADM